MRMRAPKLAIPDHCHPLVRALFEEMAEQQLSLLDMAERSGINKNTLKDWRTRTVPTISNLDACFHVLGLRLVARYETDDPSRRPMYTRR